MNNLKLEKNENVISILRQLNYKLLLVDEKDYYIVSTCTFPDVNVMMASFKCYFVDDNFTSNFFNVKFIDKYILSYLENKEMITLYLSLLTEWKLFG